MKNQLTQKQRDLKNYGIVLAILIAFGCAGVLAIAGMAANWNKKVTTQELNKR